MFKLLQISQLWKVTQTLQLHITTKEKKKRKMKHETKGYFKKSIIIINIIHLC